MRNKNKSKCEIKNNDKFCPECSKPNKRNTIQEKITDATPLELSNLTKGFTLDKDRYRIESNLGNWALGTVYKAWDNESVNWKFIKIIDHIYSQDNEVVADLKREVNLLKKIHSDNVARICDFHYQSEIKFIDMEYVDGEDLICLKLKYPDKIVPEEIVLNLIEQICSGMQAIQNQNIVHKGLRLSNILITKSGTVKIMDLDICGISGNKTQYLQKMGVNVIPAYLSPEQLMGNNAVFESDIWSFGVIIFELLTGKQLYTGQSYADVLFQIDRRVIEPIQRVSDKLNIILLSCLVKDFKKRLRFFDQVLELLKINDEKSTCENGKQLLKGINNKAKKRKRQRLWKLARSKNSYYPKIKSVFLTNNSKVYNIILILFIFVLSIGFEIKWQQLIERDKNFVFIKGGNFEMESRENKSGYYVTLDDFYIGKYEITVGEFKQFIESTNYVTDIEKEDKTFITHGEFDEKNAVTWRCDVEGNTHEPNEYNHPVIRVSWKDMVAFCNEKSKSFGLEPCYSGGGNNIKCDFSKNGYRLPTVAEWEFASRGWKWGSKKGQKSDGKENLLDFAWLFENSDQKTHSVGQKQANELGIFDMYGNVSELCNDWRYYDSSTSKRKRYGHGISLVERGGSWYDRAERLHRVSQYSFNSKFGNERIGFRIVRKSK
jgi:serine/threonine protein kinase